MKFILKKTSDWGDNKPCKEAVKITVPRWHTRTCTQKYFNEHFAGSEGLWKSKGKNHKTVNGCITRQEEDRKVWGIEIDSLDELIKLVDKYGDFVLSHYDYADDENIYELEIYDRALEILEKELAGLK